MLWNVLFSWIPSVAFRSYYHVVPVHETLPSSADLHRVLQGNWATDLSAGSEFGYLLLFAVLLSSLAAMFLQYLSLKLGVAGERDLAQACRDAYPR